MRETISLKLREFVLKRDHYQCRYCGSKTEPFHLDHVYPVIKGGETSKNNLVTSCVRCNAKKHSSVGMWPKPIGYFDEPHPSSLSAFLCVWGILQTLAGSAVWFIDHNLGFYMIIFGAVVEFVGIHLKKEQPQ